MLTTASLYELNEITPGGGENESGVYGLLGDVSPLSSPTYISVLPFDFNCGEHWAKNLDSFVNKCFFTPPAETCRTKFGT